VRRRSVEKRRRFVARSLADEHRTEPALVVPQSDRQLGSDEAFSGTGDGATYQYGSRNCGSPGTNPALMVLPSPRV
jgi:hypothetical protein